MPLDRNAVENTCRKMGQADQCTGGSDTCFYRSGIRGNPKAYRPEKDYLKRYVSKSAGRIKVDNLKKETGLTEQEIITSYGLMQPLFTLAYGYGARTVEDLYDPNLNIRYCTAHISTLMEEA